MIPLPIRVHPKQGSDQNFRPLSLAFLVMSNSVREGKERARTAERANSAAFKIRGNPVKMGIKAGQILA
jgi:hypothetical protein